MNNDKHVAEVERLAREAGLVKQKYGSDGLWLAGTTALARFAALVRADALEQAAREFDRRDTGPDGKPLGIGFYDPHEPAEIIRAMKDAP